MTSAQAGALLQVLRDERLGGRREAEREAKWWGERGEGVERGKAARRELGVLLWLWETRIEAGLGEGGL
jgi:hypothetical protein